MNTASRFTVNTLMTIVFMNVDSSKRMTNSNAYLGINLQFQQGKYCRLLLHVKLIKTFNFLSICTPSKAIRIKEFMNSNISVKIDCDYCLADCASTIITSKLTSGSIRR